VAERRARALEEPLDIRLRREAPYPLYEVRNPIHRTVYLVMLPEFPARTGELCTCTDFARRGLGTCKHIEATYRYRTEHPDPARTPTGTPAEAVALWKEIDRRLARPAPGPAPNAVRRPGAVLFEDPG